MKKAKKSSALPEASTEPGGFKSNEKASLLKRIVDAIPGNQPKRIAGASSGPPRESHIRHTDSQAVHATMLSSAPKNSASPLPWSSHPDIGRQNIFPPVNLNTLTPSSSEDESSDSERSPRPFSPSDILPFTSKKTDMYTEGTTMDTGPFPPPASSKAFNAPEPTSFKRLRSISVNGDIHRRVIRAQAKMDQAHRLMDQKTLDILEGKPANSTTEATSDTLLNPGDGKHKRGRRVTLVPTVVIRPNLPRRPISQAGSISEMFPSPSKEWVPSWNARKMVARPDPPSDPFNHLFASCALSIFLLIVLAAGKDILYVMALLPVFMALAKHFLDFNQLGLYAPLMTRNLESLLSI